MRWQGEELQVVRKYYQDASPCIELWAEDGPYAVATCWVPGLRPGEVAIKDWTENEGILEVLIGAGVVAPPHRLIPTGFVQAKVCVLL